MASRQYIAKWKSVLTTLGLLSVPSSLFITYHATLFSLSRIHLDILELERDKQSYIEYIQPIFSTANTATIGFNDDYNYINIPIWQRLRTKRGPRYWAKVARTCGPMPKALAVEILSRLHDLPDGVMYSAALACDSSTLIQLATEKALDTDIRFFIPPRTCYHGSEHMSTQIYRFLHKVSHTDGNVSYLADILLGRTPPLSQENVDQEDDDFEFTHEIVKPRRADLTPPAQSLVSLTESSLDIIKHHTKEAEGRHSFIYKEEGLQLLTRIWSVFKSNESIMCRLADILLNITIDRENHSVLVTGGFLHLLVLWMRSLNKELGSKATTALSNFTSSTSRYESNVYLLQSSPQELSAAEVDVVFIHGINGGTFYTWRQHPSMNGSEDYTRCWPMDWLTEEFGSDVRAVGVDSLTFNSTNWSTRRLPNTLSIEQQAKCIASKLRSCKIGEGRKVVWVGHSMGGILIKCILNMAQEQLPYHTLLVNTHSVIFMGVPHRGCPAAMRAQRASYIASPTIPVQELADSAKMLDINSSFAAIVNEKQIRCINFMEGAKIKLKANIRLHVVPPEYSELDVGENVLLPEDNHITICKPKDKSSRVFTALVDLLNQIIHSPSPGTQPIDAPEMDANM